MAIFHVATNTPPKSELISEWVRAQVWGPPGDRAVELVGSFHLEDPEGQVGMQTFIVRAGNTLFHVPLSYRAQPLAGAEEHLVGTLDHSALGTRYVYDGLHDERFLLVFAGVAVTGYGQSLGFLEHDGRWYSASDEVLIQGSGLRVGQVAVDRFEVVSQDDTQIILANDSTELTVYRRLTDRPAPNIGLIATWHGQSDPITLVDVREV